MEVFLFVKNIPRRVLLLLQTFLYIYLILKLQIFNNFKEFNDPLYRAFFSIALVLPTLLVAPVLLIVYFALRVYKLIILHYLKYKFGPSYDGTPLGNDVIFTLESKKSEWVVNSISAVEYPEDDFFQRAKSRACDRLKDKRIERLFSTRESFMGYTYFKRCDFHIDEYVRSFDVTANKVATMAELQDALGPLLNAPLPKNNKATWEVLVANQPVMWENGRAQRIFLFRVHHVVGDGVSIYRILVTLFADVATAQEPPQAEHILSEKRLTGLGKHLLHQDLKHLLDLCIKFIKLIANIHLKYRGTKDYEHINALHGPELSGEKRLSWIVEKDPVYVQRIKDIKNRVPGTTFSDVLFTAISASVAAFFAQQQQQQGHQQLSHIQVAVPIHSQPGQLGHYEAGDLDSIVLDNKFLYGFVDLPILGEGQSALSIAPTLLDRLAKVKKEFKLLKESMDFQLNSFCNQTVFNIATPGMLNVLFGSDEQTMSISSMPGNRALTCLGCHVTDVLFYTPHMRRNGVGLTFTSYNGRVQLGLITDTAVMKEKQQLQVILEGVVKYINVLDDVSRNKI